MHLDKLLTDHIGEFGKYQIFTFILISLVEFPTAFSNMGIVFIAGVPEHWCNVPGLNNLSVSLISYYQRHNCATKCAMKRDILYIGPPHLPARVKGHHDICFQRK